ncbi:MAG: amidophosphoribosyltransferase [Elusimicrobiota bacterium]
MCGIIGVWGHKEAVRVAYLGLYALQHRGQEAAGLVAALEDGSLSARHGLGLLADAVPAPALSSLRGRSAVGHVRYATAGDGTLKNAQPLVFDTVHGPIALSHNGTLTNAKTLRSELERRGAIFRTTTDSEVIAHLIARHAGPLEDAFLSALSSLEGAYSLLLLTPTTLLASRDPLGFRPLVLGRLGRSWVFASETTALNLLGARGAREIAPGETVAVEEGRLRVLERRPAPRTALCVFEQVYFARPDSSVFGRSVQGVRRALGRELARQMLGSRPEAEGAAAAGEMRSAAARDKITANGRTSRFADLVVPVPDSGVPAALGFSQESGIPFEIGFVRSHYIGRTFIQPAQVLRERSVQLKLLPVPEAVRGRSIVLIDDSIVRGTTSRRICRMLRRSGAKNIHMAISSPPILSPCYYGIDTPRREELIAATRSVEEIRKFLGVDTLTYLSVEGMLRAANGTTPAGSAPLVGDDHCISCFTGRYPTPLTDLVKAPCREIPASREKRETAFRGPGAA